LIDGHYNTLIHTDPQLNRKENLESESM